jgi:hypothetical protein
MKFLTKILVFSLLAMQFSFFSSHAQAESKVTPATVKLVKSLTLTVPEGIDQSIIDMYKSGGWEYTNNQLIKRVSYPNLTVKYKGKEYITNADGEVELPLKSDGEEVVEIEVDEFQKKGKPKKNIKLKPGKKTVIDEYINLNDLLQSMDKQFEEVPGEEKPQVGKTLDHGLKDGQLPAYKQYVHCNRFNGYQGNGRYYANEASPQAIKNFFQSDCDVALARSSNCLKDYLPDADSRYCAIHPYSKNGRCSGFIVNHAVYYHKHTSWFGPAY